LFRKTNPCPAISKTTGACPGYQIDHRTPPSKGGADTPENMQWLSTVEHKAKTAREARR
jgi:5-methylcytosine-specific restriction endonuclease McrA